MPAEVILPAKDREWELDELRWRLSWDARALGEDRSDITVLGHEGLVGVKESLGGVLDFLDALIDADGDPSALAQVVQWRLDSRRDIRQERERRRHREEQEIEAEALKQAQISHLAELVLAAFPGAEEIAQI